MEEDKLAARAIFEQLTILQKQLTENSQTSLHRLGDAISSNFDGDEGEGNYEQIADICDVFMTRELTLMKLLGMYEKNVRRYSEMKNSRRLT